MNKQGSFKVNVICSYDTIRTGLWNVGGRPFMFPHWMNVQIQCQPFGKRSEASRICLCAVNGGTVAKMLVRASSEEKEILSKDAELIWRYIMDDESCDGIEKVENKGISLCFFWFVGPSQHFKDCVPQQIHLLSLIITILVRIIHLFLPVDLLFGWLSPPATHPAHTLSVGFEVA